MYFYLSSKIICDSCVLVCFLHTIACIQIGRYYLVPTSVNWRYVKVMLWWQIEDICIWCIPDDDVTLKLKMGNRSILWTCTAAPTMNTTTKLHVPHPCLQLYAILTCKRQISFPQSITSQTANSCGKGMAGENTVWCWRGGDTVCEWRQEQGCVDWLCWYQLDLLTVWRPTVCQPTCHIKCKCVSAVICDGGVFHSDTHK
jgi:hypothetical protein